MNPPDSKVEVRRVEHFNALYNIGKAVDVRNDDGTVASTVTKTRAWVVDGHAAIVVSGFSGLVRLDRVTPISVEEARRRRKAGGLTA